jgi:hypothetical protein
MHWKARIGTVAVLALSPSVAWATEATMPLGAVFMSSMGAITVGFAGFLGLKLYGALRGGELGSAWQTAAFSLLFLAVAMIVETLSGAGWVPVSEYVGGFLKVLAAAGLVLSFLRFARVFK